LIEITISKVRSTEIRMSQSAAEEACIAKIAILKKRMSKVPFVELCIGQDRSTEVYIYPLPPRDPAPHLRKNRYCSLDVWPRRNV
jgi:hypothetical protein